MAHPAHNDQPRLTWRLAPGELMQGLSSFLDAEDFADFTLRYGDKTRRVHKLVLCCHSEFFSRALRSSQFIEAQENTMDLEHGSAELLDAMIKYMYKLDYTAPASGDVLEFHIRMYTLADFYCIPFLKRLAEDKYADALRIFIGNDQHTEAEWADFFASLGMAFNDEIVPVHARELRELVARFCVAKYVMLQKQPAFDELMEGTPGLTLAMARHMAEVRHQTQQWQCHDCGQMFRMPSPHTIIVSPAHVSCPNCQSGNVVHRNDG